ncbi:DNA replication and repair protein RecF, partial [Candidatus Saccharibacteria bacterium]|nr:DNA replication and repair protein RecF [Candidatus Saccharibacteria bacterium]
DASFEFGTGVNIIVGPNASGKTNLLEALLLISNGSSYRAADAELITHSKEWARIDVHVDGAVERSIKLQQKKTYIIDEKEYQRLTHAKKLPIVLFEPNHLLILPGPPEGRRAYLDDLLEQTNPEYSSLRKNYRRVVAQRNALLKHPHAHKQDFFPWNLRLSELGAVIHRARAELVTKLNTDIKPLYKELSSGSTEIELTYDSKFPSTEYESRLLHALEDNLNKDIARGFTSYGPHREDMGVWFDGHLVVDVASRGETRTATLALKILELETLQETLNQKPILLLDDVFSELDGARRRALTTHLQRYQTFLTTTDADIVIKHFTDSTIIPLG